MGIQNRSFTHPGTQFDTHEDSSRGTSSNGIGLGERRARSRRLGGLLFFGALTSLGIGTLALSSGCSFKLDARMVCSDIGCNPSGNTDLSPNPQPDLLPDVDNPAVDGPFRSFSQDLPAYDQTLVSDVKLYSPSDDGASISTKEAKFPLVILAPGHFVEPAQLARYAQRLATHGIHTVLFRSRNEQNQLAYRDIMLGLLSWLTTTSPQKDQIEGAFVGLGGYQLGGKIAIASAAQNSSVRAVLALDPIDESAVTGYISGPSSVTALSLAGDIPVAIFGERQSQGTDATACYLAAQGFQTFYPTVGPPPRALQIEFGRATSADFIDVHPDQRCKTSAAQADTQALAVKFTTAYFQWALRGKSKSREYLLGAGFDADVSRGMLTRMAQ